jgi:hypothetical protein
VEEILKENIMHGIYEIRQLLVQKVFFQMYRCSNHFQVQQQEYQEPQLPQLYPGCQVYHHQHRLLE